MKTLPRSLVFSCAFVLALSLIAAPLGFAASSVVGKWTLEIDFGGTAVPADLEIVENADGSLKGVLNSVQGAMELETVVHDRNTISFEQEVDMGGAPMTFSFTGTVDGETFTGTLSSDMGDMAVTGERAGAEGPGIVGTWEVESDSQLGVLQRTLTINDDLSGSYASDDASWDVSALSVDGDTVTFEVTVEAQGQEIPLSFEGKLDGDSLAGDFLADGSSIATVTASRKSLGLDAFVGEWSLSVASQIGDFEHALTFTSDGAVYTSDDDTEAAVTDIAVDGDSITFFVDIIAGGDEYPLEFEGALENGELIGEFLMDGTSVADITGTRGGALSRDSLAGKWALEIDSPLGLLNHILIIPADGAVTYDQEGDVTDVTDFKIEGNEVSFGIDVQGYQVVFIGGLEDGGLNGDLHMDGEPVATVIGEKE